MSYKAVNFSFFLVFSAFLGLALDALSAESDPNAVIYYVNGTEGSNNNNGLSPATAFATIQKAIDTAQNGNRILVFPGTYSEGIALQGKSVTVKSIHEPAILQNPGNYAVSLFSGEQADCIIENLIITNSTMAFFLVGTAPTLRNLTLVNNQYGIVAYAGSLPTIYNCILWDNSDGDIFNCSITYSCVESPEVEGIGVFHDNPLFADPINMDYHLKSYVGRYHNGSWISDMAISPAIDAGNPASNPTAEPMPSGGRINAGAYGGTPYASKSPHPWIQPADLNYDGTVDLLDFTILSNNWLWTAVWY